MMQPTHLPLPDAEALAEEFKEFVYIVAHDFNTDLRGIVELTKLLQAQQGIVLDDDSREYLALVISSGEKMQARLNALLEYSRITTMAKPVAQVDVGIIVKKCNLVLQDKMKTAHVTWGVMPQVMGDADQLKLLFLTLLDNALTYHYKDKVPTVTITAEKMDADWLFRVQDNGIGIGQDYHERIFKPFQRLHDDKDYPGIGMGLTIARKIVQRHGGHIKMESILTEGSVFTFTLPAQ